MSEVSADLGRRMRARQGGRVGQSVFRVRVARAFGKTPVAVETLTFLFTDIEGSTALYERVGAVFRSALAMHHALLRAEVERAGGQMLRDTGDGVVAAFSDPARATVCAVAAQEALERAEWPPETGPLRVRMGVHRGPAVFEDGD